MQQCALLCSYKVAAPKRGGPGARAELLCPVPGRGLTPEQVQSAVIVNSLGLESHQPVILYAQAPPYGNEKY